MNQPFHRALTALGVPIPPAFVDSLLVYAEELITWNCKINLTGAKTVQSFIEGPLFDALSLLSVIESEGSLVDIGSGGGLPGIPASICVPALRVTLVEPRAKRTSFLRHVVHKLGLEVEIRELRDEALPPHQFDAAVAQAVWKPAQWLERATRLIRPGGAIYVLSSDPIATTNLPPHTKLEASQTLVRPKDGKYRYCGLVRV